MKSGGFLLGGLLWLILAPWAWAENYTLAGDMASEIRYEMKQQITTGDGVRRVTLSFVVPKPFHSQTYRQEIKGFNLAFEPKPQESKTSTDPKGNEVVTATWTKIPAAIDVSLSLTALNRTGLSTLETNSPFPHEVRDPKLREYLAATEQVQADHPRIQELSARLTRDARTKFDATQKIISHVVDNLQYVTPPVRYDALYSLESGRGNCQNYSHLSAALLRAAGIPVRIVNGITLNEPFDINWQKGVLTFKMGQGRHSWIEVWFSDLGWVPFDPQNSQLFVSNRFIRVEVGLDNNDTKNDGLVRWSQAAEAKTKPRLTEIINATFSRDQVAVRGERQDYGPKNLLLTPRVKAQFTQIALAPPPKPPQIPDKEIIKRPFNIPFVFGNILFPEDVDFAFPRKTAASGKNQFEMTKNFLVETAEYVTTKITQYAQVAVLDKPVKLERVGLALKKFGGDGWLWVDIFADEGGKPGKPLATSELVDLDQLSLKPGYRWVDFSFAKEGPLLDPGSYWIGLGFTGSPIVNWFYTYGKPVGPIHGTRYKGVFEADWSGALSYEFIYRIAGLTN